MANLVEVVVTANDNASGTFAKVAAEATAMEASFGKAASSSQTLGGALSSAGGAVGSIAAEVAKASLLVGGTLVAGIGGAVAAFAGFEQTMSGVKAVSGATGDELAQLSALAIQLGQDTTLSGVGAKDAARAMEELAKGGVSVADQLGGATRGALLLASAGGLDFATAATIASDAMNTFKLSGADIPHVADLFANAANKSSLEVVDLAESMKYVGPVAAAMGLSIDETTAALAELGAQGIKGSEAGTSLRTMMVDLAKPTKQMKEVMDEYNLSFFDANGHMKNMAGIAEELHSKLGGLTEQQRLNALATLFGKEALSAAVIVYEQGGQGIDDWTAKVSESGTAARVGAERNNNLAGSVTQLKDTIETAAITLGGKFAPAIREGSDALAGFLNNALKSPEFQRAIDDLATNATHAIEGLIAKLKDPAVQAQMREWATAALDVGKAVVALAGDVKDTLGPVVTAAVGWFDSLDQGGKKNVVTFALVAGAAVHFRDELKTLLTAGNDVIKMFGAKEAAKKTLTAANEKLAQSAAETAGKFGAVRGAAVVAGEAIAAGTVVTVAATAAWAGIIAGMVKYRDATGETARMQQEFTAAQSASAFAIAHGANETNGAVAGFTRYIDATRTGVAT
ncbi:MAG: phage tail tape measure protein, partial [Sphingomonadales bacterium]|nr:phage tail tape measure protein [Sphingomonadales bacterium]